jgi:molybdate transport system regulatory protein
MVLVAVRLSGGDRVTACITRESAELLALQAGLAVLVLCKATAVAVAAVNAEVDAQANPVRSQGNLLHGRVARVARGTSRDEVVLTLSGDLQLVGFSDKSLSLRVGSRVTACVDQNALVLAQF